MDRSSGRRKWFTMDPPAVPSVPVEQTPTVDVYAVLRDHMKYVALIHNELRQQRRDKQEMEMKVSELSSKVDSLISVATDLKGRVDAGSSGGVGAVTPQPEQQDDPEVEALAHRIDDAIAVLKGEKTAEEPAPVDPVPPSPFVNDPNAPL